jgi:hypothetical protein
VELVRRIRIPLEDLTKKQKENIDDMIGKQIIVESKEPCLTCGHKTRVRHIVKTDGKKEIIEECLYCLCTHHTKQNKEGM